MTLETAILSFLAARYPAAFEAAVIRTRINRSGAIDKTVTDADVTEVLLRLANRFGKVELITRDDGVQYWSATPKGVSAWTLDGSPYIGG